MIQNNGEPKTKIETRGFGASGLGGRPQPTPGTSGAPKHEPSKPKPVSGTQPPKPKAK